MKNVNPNMRKLAGSSQVVRSKFNWNGRFVLVGSSTGGVEALEIVLSQFPVNCPPTLVSQHMPEQYLRRFSQRLDRKILPRVRVAHGGALVEQGTVYLAPGGATHLEISHDPPITCQLKTGEKVNGHRPSIDVLFGSAHVFAKNIVAVLLTGMGADGAKGLLSLHKRGATTIGQDEATSVVYGMPRAAAELGALTHQTALPEIAEQILSCCSSGSNGMDTRGNTNE